MGLSSIASLSLGLSMSMTGTPAGAMMMRNLGVSPGGPFSRNAHGNSAAANRLGLPTFRGNFLMHSPNSRRHGAQSTSGCGGETPTSGGDKPTTTPEAVPEVSSSDNDAGDNSSNDRLAANTTTTLPVIQQNQVSDNMVDHVRVELADTHEERRPSTFDNGPDVVIIHDSRPTEKNGNIRHHSNAIPSTVCDRVPVFVNNSFGPASLSHHQQLQYQPPARDFLLAAPSPPTISICSPTSGNSSDNDDIDGVDVCADDDDDDDDADTVDEVCCSSSGESLSRVLSGTQLSVDPRSYYIPNGGSELPAARQRLAARGRVGRAGGGGVVNSHVVPSSSYLDRRSKRLMRKCFGGRTLKGVWNNGRAASMSEQPLTERDQNASWDKVRMHCYFHGPFSELIHTRQSM